MPVYAPSRSLQNIFIFLPVYPFARSVKLCTQLELSYLFKTGNTVTHREQSPIKQNKIKWSAKRRRLHRTANIRLHQVHLVSCQWELRAAGNSALWGLAKTQERQKPPFSSKLLSSFIARTKFLLTMLDIAFETIWPNRSCHLLKQYNINFSTRTLLLLECSWHCDDLLTRLVAKK